ncbi:isochorismatase family protein [Streptomyces griseoruber]|uniref:isochorismatase family protein n=1 Tax=Streptomyces griseoruber TaxID=1943 RepID=UPI0037B6939B
MLRRNVIALTKVAKVRSPCRHHHQCRQRSERHPAAGDCRRTSGRPGETDAFNTPDFAAAVKATGREQMIVAGISADVCVAFAAQSAVAAGYQVHAVLDASGTWNQLATQAAYSRLEKAGVTLNNTVAVAAELQRDWRDKGGQELAGLMAAHAIPFYGSLLPYVTPAA